MRRLLAAAVVGSVLGGTAVVASAGDPAFNSRCGEYDCRVEPVPAAWGLVEVGRDLQTLTLFYDSGGCLQGNGRATVVETASRIHISVEQDKVVALDTPDGEFGCTREILWPRLRVRLDGPVAGRKIRGGPTSRSNDWVPTDKRGFPLVPRVLDLAASDAVDLLRRQRFKVRRDGTATGRVVAQTPSARRPAKRVIVRITISRGPLAPPRKVTLTSAGARIDAPVGNWCSRGTDALVGCNQAYFPGHPPGAACRCGRVVCSASTPTTSRSAWSCD